MNNKVEIELDPLKKAVYDQKKYYQLRLIFTLLLIVTFGISTYAIYQYQQLKEKALMSSEQTLSIRTDLINDIYLNWNALSRDSTKTLNVLRSLILANNDYEDSTLQMLQDKIKHAGDLNDILFELIEDPDTASIIKQLNSSDSAIMALQNTVAVSKNSPALITMIQIDKINLDVQTKLASFENPKIDSAIRLTPTVDPSLLTDSRNKKISTTHSEDLGIKWFKPGYYLQYDNVRIALLELNKKTGIKITVCNTPPGAEDCGKKALLVDEKWISFRAPVSLSVDGSKYQISLQSIDRGGNNPFNLAAYINVLKLGSDSSNFFLQNSAIKLYSVVSTSDKATEINTLLNEHGVSSKNLGTPEGYTLNGVSKNQIVYYNGDQLQKCIAVKQLLESKTFGEFEIRKSSGFGYNTDHFKIYLVR